MKTIKSLHGEVHLILNHGKLDIPVENISYLESDGNYSRITLTTGAKKISSFTLRRFIEILPSNNFFLSRRGLFLNLNRIAVLEYKGGKYRAIMKNKQVVQLSRRKGKELFNCILMRELPVKLLY